MANKHTLIKKSDFFVSAEYGLLTLLLPHIPMSLPKLRALQPSPLSSGSSPSPGSQPVPSLVRKAGYIPACEPCRKRKKKVRDTDSFPISPLLYQIVHGYDTPLLNGRITSLIPTFSATVLDPSVLDVRDEIWSARIPMSPLHHRLVLIGSKSWRHI